MNGAGASLIKTRVVERAGRWYAVTTVEGRRKYNSLRAKTREEAEAKFASLSHLDVFQSIYPTKHKTADREVRWLWKKAKDRAKTRGLSFSLLTGDVRDLMLRSQGRCAVSGLPFDTTFRPNGVRRRPFSPSIDRIDCSRGYELDNVRVVCSMVNQAMGEWGEEALFRIATAMVLKSQRHS